MANSRYDFLQSRAVRGYNPQFLDTEAQMPSSQAGLQASPDLNARMLQILSGNLGGTLTGGEKLSALGALLKSVSRGSQTTPQQVLQGLQQQKLQQVQGALQIQELQKQAGQQAKRNALREELMANAGSDAERAQIRILSDEALDKFALQRLEQKAPEMEGKRKQFEEYYRIYDEQGPTAASVYWKLVAPGQVVGSIETGLKIVDTPEPPKRSAVAAPSAVAPTDGTSPQRTITELTPPQTKPTVVDPNRIPQIETGLAAIADLRNLSQKFLSAGKQAGNIAESPIFGSLFGQNRANLEGSLEILRGIIIQDQLARLAKLNPAGIASLANSPSEQERFVSAIANLDPNQDPEQLLIGLKRAEDYLKRQKAEAIGQRPIGTQPRTFTIDGRTVTIRPRG